MARSLLPWRSAWAGPASRTVQALARPLRATLAAAAAVALAGVPLLAVTPAAAQPRRPAGQPAPLQLNVTSFSPSFAEPGHTITITGKIRNTTSSPVSGLTVEAWAASTRFGSRTDLLNFAHGTLQPAGEAQVTRAPAAIKPQLDAGHSWIFRLQVPSSALGFSCFGVYPLTVLVTDSALQVAREPVPLPYWPSSPVGCAQRPKPFPVSWVWPLIDVPHQGVCAGLTDNGLAASLGPAGRLGYLLAVGRRYATSAALTWAVDPALLDNARAMRGPHDTGYSPRCDDGQATPASKNARLWLDGVGKATAGRPVFATPYADGDVAALAKYGDQSDLVAALAAGNKVMRKILGRGPAPASGQPGSRQLSPIAWPPGGTASEALLNDLAGSGTSTVILTAPAESPASYTPGAVTSLLPGVGRYLHVLLADRPISTLLGSRQAASPDSGNIFRVSQLYLAQTAMIAAEAPATVRPIVVAPPRRWNPPRRLASGLLADTVAAPWLTPVTADQLASMPPEHQYPSLATSVSKGEISRSLLTQVGSLEKRIALLQSIQVYPSPDLNRAVFAIESSAWRGKAGKHARVLLARTARYVQTQLSGLSIRGSSGKHSVLHVTFGGRSSSVPVAIFNNLRYPVLVRLQVHAKNAQVSGAPVTVRIASQSYSQSVKITISLAKNQHGRITLSMTAPNGQPLPAYPLAIVVHKTDLGIIALIIGSAGLALFVIASAMRAIRSGRPGPAAQEAESGDGPGEGDPGAVSPGADSPSADSPSADSPAADSPSADSPAADSPGADSPAADSPGADSPGTPDPEVTHAARSDAQFNGTVSPDPSPSGHSGLTTTHRHQPSPGNIESGAQGLVQPGSTPEHVDSVGANTSKLASAGSPLADRELPGHRRNGEHR
ncbi:MAG: DUF6049 family protein [Streptosporangiaceae bacterium]